MTSVVSFLLDQIPLLIRCGPYLAAVLLVLAILQLRRVHGRDSTSPRRVWRRRLQTTGAVCTGLFSLALLGVLLFNSRVSEIRQLNELEGKLLPEISFRLLQDDTRRGLADYQGKLVLVNLWASWCPPCVEELSNLDRLHSNFKNQGLVVITLSDEPREHLLEFFAKRGLGTINGYVGELELLKGIRPVSILLDSRGVLTDTVVGARDYPHFERLILEHL